jgi:hypothetical protein
MPRKIIWKELTALDWFGLISGIVGFVVDIYALSKIFTFPSSSEGVSITGWIVLFFVMVYTIFICSFYARRVLAARNYAQSRPMSAAQYERIERGATTFVYVVWIPLFVILSIMTFLGNGMIQESSIENTPSAPSVTPVVTVTPTPTATPGATSTAKPLSKEETASLNVLLAIIFGSMIGVAAGWIICLILNEAAKAVYTAFDPKYEPLD